MSRDRFREIVRDPARSRDEIVQMMRAAIDKGETELAQIAKQALDDRFPGWGNPGHKAGGARATVVGFRQQVRQFSTSKEAYVWLVERFIGEQPDFFENGSWKTEFIARGRQRDHFARDLKIMFHGSPHLARNPNNYVRLTNGWYANTNLNNSQKFDILCRFAGLMKLEYEADWRWEIENPSEGLQANQERRALADRLLAELKGSDSRE